MKPVHTLVLLRTLVWDLLETKEVGERNGSRAPASTHPPTSELGPGQTQTTGSDTGRMASDPDPSVFTAMVSRLGGPSIAPEELDWAFDTLAGARTMDFFLSRVQSGNKSLGDVALEKEERDMLVPYFAHAFCLPTDL